MSWKAVFHKFSVGLLWLLLKISICFYLLHDLLEVSGETLTKIKYVFPFLSQLGHPMQGCSDENDMRTIKWLQWGMQKLIIHSSAVKFKMTLFPFLQHLKSYDLPLSMLNPWGISYVQDFAGLNNNCPSFWCSFFYPDFSLFKKNSFFIT